METVNGAMTADQKYFGYSTQRDNGKVTTDHRFTGQKEDGSKLQFFNSKGHSMKVYRIDSDVNHYQYFLPEQESDAFKLFLDCESMAGSWIPHKVFIYKPKHKVGDLYNFSTGTLIFSPSATEKLQTFLEMAGELLPLPYKDKVYTVLNVTECINCLDTENSEWLVSQKTGEQFGTITKYIFHPNRFSESCIFKIPETSIVETLIVDWEDGEGFIDALKEHDIKGYLLTLLWSDS